MADQYHIDLEQFSLERFRRSLETSELLPGRRVLKENISERFLILESMGIKNLKDLTAALKNRGKIKRFSQASGLPEDYLTILRREANSYLPNPVNLRRFPGVAPEYVDKLAAVGIKHSKHLFERARTKSERVELSRLADLPSCDLLELVKLSDLVRIGGVGPVFARLLYDAGADTLEALSKCLPQDLFERLHVINREKGYTKAMASLKDVTYCIETASELPKAIEY